MTTSDYDQFIDFNIAFDYFSAPIIFVDMNNIIQYLNFKSLKFFQEHEETFKIKDKAFNAFDLLDNHSQFIETIFEDYDDKIQSMKLGDLVEFEMSIGMLYIHCSLTPIFNKSFERTGTCIELNDVTPIAKSLHAFDRAIDLAQEGHFDILVPVQQLNVEDPEYHIFKKVNKLFLTLNNFVADLALGLENLAGGNLNFKFNDVSSDSNNYYHSIKSDFNYTVKKVNNLVKDISSISQTIDHTVGDIMIRNSHFAMTVETEFVNAEHSKIELDECLVSLKASNSEIQQATEISDLSKRDFSLIEQLNQLLNTLSKIGHYINDINEVTVAIEMFFKIHLDGLKHGVHEMNSGNLGKGVAIIRDECNLMINKVNSAMFKIKSSLATMKLEYTHSHLAVDSIVNSVNTNIQDMNHVIQMLGLTMEAIKGSINNQSDVFDKFTNLTMGIDSLRSQTMGSIESIIIQTSELVQLSHVLNSSIKHFNFESDQHKLISNDDAIEDYASSTGIILF